MIARLRRLNPSGLARGLAAIVVVLIALSVRLRPA